MRGARGILFVFFLGLAGCHLNAERRPAPPSTLEREAVRRKPRVEPPSMWQRVITPVAGTSAGMTVSIEDQETKLMLYLPAGWEREEKLKRVLTVHFHGAPWFIIQEHERRKSKHPLLCVHLGEGSSVYQRAFQDCGRWPQLVKKIERELASRSGAYSLSGVEVSSFSAGYGAVRELLLCNDSFRQISRIVLADSMYASVQTNSAGNREVSTEQIEVWVPFAQAAMAGGKTFVFSRSEVPTTSFASSSECAAALLIKLAITSEPADPALAATRDPDFPLQTIAHCGQFFLWGYAGTNAAAHLTHVRHLADVWQALDAMERPSGK